MRRSTLPLLLVVVAPLVVLGCGDDLTPYCYAEDDSGAVRDSVRPDPGYVCVASVSVPSARDSVRPDTSASVRLRAARRADLR